MIAQEEIRQMSIQEKLLLMEAVWEDLSSRAEQIEVPQWHKDLLDAREAAVREGKAEFIAWEKAKKQIDDTVRE